MGGTERQVSRRVHFRLVEPTAVNDPPPILTDRDARMEFEELTQRLLDAAIEIMDLSDGDADLEPDGDEFEDEDGM